LRRALEHSLRSADIRAMAAGAEEAGLLCQELVPLLKLGYHGLRNNRVYGSLPQPEAMLGFDTRRLNQILL